MDGWLLVLTPLALLLIVGLFRFVGCQFDSGGTPGGGFVGLGSFNYGDTIREELDLVSYWRLNDAGCGDGDAVRDEKEANPGRFRRATLAADDSLLSPAAPGTLQCSQPGLLQGSADDAIDASIDVNGGYVRVSFSADLNPAHFSVEAWVRPEWPATETGVFRCIVASRDDPGNAARGYILHAGPEVEFDDDGGMQILDETTRWQAWVGGGTRWRAVVSKTPVVRGQVTYLCATFDGTTLTLFAANESMDLDALPDFGTVPYSPNPGKPLYIGMGATERDVPDPGPLYPFKGLIQEVAVYRAALTGATVQKHIGAGLQMGM